ncbi:hypothetical protein JTE90_012310 [Oedothorax gibbosus]|uniref:Solute carrier family 25 member 51 n=1 Tax=Oedothorax gibbosus TaxID=931172 RepID=A0AAV6VKR7_9ARAC|nr:hypothetical protein JTE90_012310 [Oedothorax gibbosus]
MAISSSDMTKSIPHKLPPDGTDHMVKVEEFVCGWGSAFINIIITFPINKVMFRQMLHGVNSQHAFRQIHREGMQFLYRGCLPPLLQKTTSVSLMFGIFNTNKSYLDHNFPNTFYITKLCLSGVASGASEAILTPFERVQTLLQDKHYNSKYRNTYHAFQELRTNFGIKEYFRGFTPILIRNSIGNIFFFGLKDPVNDLFPPMESLSGKLFSNFMSGAFVGALTSTIFYPVNVVKTKMQVCCGTPFLSITEGFRLIFNERGRSIRRLYLGVHVNYSRAFLSWGIINASNELLKKMFFNEGNNIS